MKYVFVFMLLLALLAPAFGCPGSTTVMPTTESSGLQEDIPQYGGTLVVAQTVWSGAGAGPGQNPDFDNLVLSGACYEPLAYGDWARGPGGTGEFTFAPFSSGTYNESVLAGIIADYWEISQDGRTLTVYLRQGVRFHDKAPAYGREVTADDVKYVYKRRLARPQGVDPLDISSLISAVRVIDRYTVAFDLKAFDFRVPLDILTSSYSAIYPHEAVDPTTGKLMPSVVCGTGPYVLTD